MNLCGARLNAFSKSMQCKKGDALTPFLLKQSYSVYCVGSFAVRDKSRLVDGYDGRVCSKIFMV